VRPRIVVVGSMRSGTGYVSRVLSECGVRCGHEAVFNYDGFGGWKDYAADSSWLALPALSSLENVLIVHLVRHPVAVARSATSFFHQGPEDSVYHRTIHQMIPDVFSTRSDPLERFAYYWVAWNRLVDTHVNDALIEGRCGAIRWRVEDLISTYDHQFGTVLRTCGYYVSDERANRSLKMVPLNYNTHAVVDPHPKRYTWDDLETTLVGSEIGRLAREYGYEPKSEAPWV